MEQMTKSDFRYAIEETPKGSINHETGSTHMVVDQSKTPMQVEFFGDFEECQDWLQRLLQR